MNKKSEGPRVIHNTCNIMVGNPFTLENLLEYLKNQTSFERETLLREMEILKSLENLEKGGSDLPQAIKNCIVGAKRDTRTAIAHWQAYLIESVATMLPRYFVTLIMDELAMEVRVIKSNDPE